MLLKGGAFPVSGKSGHSEAKSFGQQFGSKQILESRIQFLKTKITNTEKSLVLIRATFQEKDSSGAM